MWVELPGCKEGKPPHDCGSIRAICLGGLFCIHQDPSRASDAERLLLPLHSHPSLLHGADVGRFDVVLTT